MLRLKHKGRVEKGKFKAYDELKFRSEFYTREGKEVLVTIEPVTKVKSNNQNSYYRGVVLPILAMELFGGQDRKTCNEMHSALGLMFFSRTDDKTGLEYICSTTNSEWGTVKWEKTVEEIKRWASVEHSIFIPDPNEVTW